MSFQKKIAGAALHDKIASLDHLRALAIILVFIFHYRMFKHPEWVDTIGHFGWTGVDLFFVLSGYLIAGQLFRTIAKGKAIDLKTFFLKRFFRIIPVYLVVLSLYFFIPAFREREALSPLWKFLTFTQNFGLDLSHHGTFSHAWSLCIEEQFYLLLPFLVTGFVYFKAGKKGFYLVVLLFLAGFAIRLISWNKWVVDANDFVMAWYQWIYYPTYCRLDGLLTGVSVAGLYQFFPHIKNIVSKYGNWWLLAGLALLTVAYFLCDNPYSFGATIFGFPLVAIGYGVVLAAVVCPGCILYKFSSRISSGIATLSYSIYLSHKGVIHLTQGLLVKWGIEGDSIIMFLFCAGAVVMAALLLRYTIEKPFLRLRERMLDKRTTSHGKESVEMVLKNTA
ncbi:peptidoglycan/LPS O-acetylase OafA/YrhL [Chitinophaga niastensis]|uniref:Peptidoglycan/LPS O-acetylase OafA/YrhL n=1 Tax=Chitinophaga niastensis TaxID=536980 RepID=A0A2P8HEV4_CHINA|nr:acyltransferase [Chitinophaga niastensis]PSL44750.1 peptidoglycan/LPS O-acetylase OafA/YrhL [Chitinophaga niastensis]